MQSTSLDERLNALEAAIGTIPDGQRTPVKQSIANMFASIEALTEEEQESVLRGVLSVARYLVPNPSAATRFPSSPKKDPRQNTSTATDVRTIVNRLR